MITFFRRFRQKFLAEKRLSKYLLYAIGEIALVMIGILLALQVNNWNENRKNKSLLASYTKSLIQDLQQDTIILNELISFATKDSTRLSELQDRLSSPNSNLDTLKHITRYELPYEYKVHRPPNTNTLLAMQSNGIIELYEKDMYNRLIGLQTNQNIIGSILKSIISDHNKQFIALNSKYALDKNKVIDGPLLETAWKNVDGDDLFRRVESYLGTRTWMNNKGNERRRELLMLTEEVLERLIAISKNE